MFDFLCLPITINQIHQYILQYILQSTQTNIHYDIMISLHTVCYIHIKYTDNISYIHIMQEEYVINMLDTQYNINTSQTPICYKFQYTIKYSFLIQHTYRRFIRSNLNVQKKCTMYEFAQRYQIYQIFKLYIPNKLQLKVHIKFMFSMHHIYLIF